MSFVESDKMPYYRDLLSDLCELDEGLTGREIELIDNLSEWDGDFTVGQAEYLERVWKNKC